MEISLPYHDPPPLNGINGKISFYLYAILDSPRPLNGNFHSFFIFSTLMASLKDCQVDERVITG